MKILVLCYEYPPIGGGGGRVARTIAEQLVKRGHEVRVQTAGMRHLPARETLGGVQIFRTQSFRRREDTCSVHEMALFLVTSFFPMLRHLSRWKPDVVHAHFAMPTGLLAWAGRKLFGTPYLLTAHLGDVPGAIPDQTDTLFKIINPVARKVWEEAAGVTAVSEFVRELAEAAYHRPVRKILNGIELADRPEELMQTKSGEQSDGTSLPRGLPRLVFVGRFNPQKNLLFLIDVLAELKELPWKITIIGDGPLMPAVREKISTHGLHSRAELTGWLSTGAVEEVLRTADILCMPSTVEGMPVAAVEALKFGLAIVGSAIPGLRDVLTDGENGFAVPVGDADAYANALRNLMRNDLLLSEMKRASYKKAAEFDLDAITMQYEEALSKAAATGGES